MIKTSNMMIGLVMITTMLVLAAPAQVVLVNNLTAGNQRVFLDNFEGATGASLAPQTGTWAGAQIVDLLENCQHRTIIPRHLRPNIDVAHKHGASRRNRADLIAQMACMA